MSAQCYVYFSKFLSMTETQLGQRWWKIEKEVVSLGRWYVNFWLEKFQWNWALRLERSVWYWMGTSYSLSNRKKQKEPEGQKSGRLWKIPCLLHLHPIFSDYLQCRSYLRTKINISHSILEWKKSQFFPDWPIESLPSFPFNVSLKGSLFTGEPRWAENFARGFLSLKV